MTLTMSLTRTILVAVALGLWGCAAVTPRPSQESLPSPFTEDGVSVIVEGLFKDGFGVVQGISGAATNVSGKDLSLCQITFDILDASGFKVSSANAVTNDLKAGQRWRFQASMMNPYPLVFVSIARGRVTALPVTSIGRKFDPSRLKQLTPGVSTSTEAVSLFGPPQSEINFGNGTRLLQWIFTEGN